MKKFMPFVIVLTLMILGYQLMEYNKNHVDVENQDINTTIVGRYNSNLLHLEFDYSTGVSFQETGDMLIINENQSIQLLTKGTGQTLQEFVTTLLTGMDKKCLFSFKTGSFLKNTSLDQQVLVNDSIDTGSGNILCESPYDDSHGVRFFLAHPEDKSRVYFFTVGVVENQNVAVYDSMRFYSTELVDIDDVKQTTTLEGPFPLSGDIETLDYPGLIKGYYSAMESHDFASAVSFVVSGEVTETRLYNSYYTATELHPFMIEPVGEQTYQFFVRYVDTGYNDYRDHQKTYVIKKSFVDGKLHSIGNQLVAGNTEIDQFMVYKDKFISLSTGKFAFSVLFDAEQMTKNRCADREIKTQEYFEELLDKAKDKGIYYTFTFTGSSLSGSKDDLSVNLYVLKNVFEYPDIGSFIDDFDLCSETAHEPVLINADYVVFLDSCTDKKKEEMEGCRDMRGIIKQSIRFK